MSNALIKLGLSDLLPESAVSVESQQWLERFMTADEWIKKVFEGIEKLPENFKDTGKLGEILEKAAPWIESGSKIFPPAHLLFQILSSFTKLNDPRDLAILACTVTYQAVADQAIREAGLPGGSSVNRRLRDSIGVTREEFVYFTIEGVLSHPFIRRADEVLEFYAAKAGYCERQTELLIGTIHSRFRNEFRLMINSGENSEKYAPLRNWLGTDPKEALTREALHRHLQYVRWLFEEAPLLDEEPYALKHIYVDTGCGILTRSQLLVRDSSGRPARDPFKRDEKNGGVHNLLDTVLRLIRDPNFKDAIVIQGSAGAGKSSFTKHLAATLALDGLTPLLVRLRDARKIGQGLFRTIEDALRYDDQLYLQNVQDQFHPPDDLLGNGSLFNETMRYHGVSICPYVLILDGWDEISLDVTDGYKQKVHALLAEIRQEFFRGVHARVCVILTGRPSDAIDSAESFFQDSTPILTIRQMTPDQLVEFAAKVRSAVNQRPLPRYSSNWTMPEDEKLGSLFERYKEGFERATGDASEQILGVPFLAQLAFRVIADPGPDGDSVATDSTALLRRLTEITVHHARLSTEHVRGTGAADNSAAANRAEANLDHLSINRLHGAPLRRLLHRTASKMTIVGRESISHHELEDYLQAGDDHSLMEEAEKAGGVTGLIVSFFFKGGNTELGCEFTHKALREYLFAEAVVECIKALGRYADGSSKPPVREHYWRDFADDDPRQQWSRVLAELLAPQWLTYPVMNHILRLLEWEKHQATATEHGTGATKPLTPAQWTYVRDSMADLYDWWAEGVPMRPQLATIKNTIKTEWLQPWFQTLIEAQLALPVKPEILAVVPPRLTTYDGHLGASLMVLTAAVHRNVFELIGQVGIDDGLRHGSRVQSRHGGEPLRFRPGGVRGNFLNSYFSRIDAAGWYAESLSLSPPLRFPGHASLSGADLSHTEPVRADLTRADLTGAYLFGANLSSANLSGANLSGADLTRANLSGANLYGANLFGANLSGADLRGANLLGANLTDADLTDADLRGANLRDANLRGADLRDANLRDADLRGAKLTDAKVTGAKLTIEDLEKINRLVNTGNLKLSDEQLATLRFSVKSATKQ